MRRLVRAVYRGRVQGVGFRFTTCRIARRFPVAGYVQNLDDGSVLVEVEGERQDIDHMLDDLATTMRQYIHQVTVHEYPANHEHQDFSVRH